MQKWAETWPFTTGLDDGGKGSRACGCTWLLGAGEGEESGSPIELPETDPAWPTPCYSPRETHSKLLTQRLEDNKSVLF